MIQKYTLALTAILIVGCESKDSDKVDDLSTTSLSDRSFILSQYLSNQHQPHAQASLEGTVTLKDEEGTRVKLTGTDSLKLVTTQGDTYAFSNKSLTNLGATPKHCCMLSAELLDALQTPSSFEIELSRNNSTTSFGTVTLPQFIEFIYPSSEQDLAAITLDSDELTLSWQPETDSDLQYLELSIEAPEQNTSCKAKMRQRWFKPSMSGGKQLPDDKLYSELNHQLNIDLSQLSECEKPWRIYLSFDYFNGQVGQQIVEFSSPP
ncbi:hypothetical protein JL49_13840 [Pseudoalteromonas luteoviolacea]|nr:hypothetical protein JL49_13840 [Pseudoalteromonas luteoviolacea]